ncbi:HAD hydrolase-like protein [Lacticaseibacillus kribbianus]|uniref:HAD hydrolase-like protein n=1 Tax=Lacticaseibacillus kribbianus TaxID=2926292 RepID=UPI001CD5FB0B|nr:HAD hydrolase-like protein [Lacticaseibacillus kribbianus]
MKHLFFDFDGTIADSQRGIVDGIHHMIEASGLAPLDEATYLTFIGPSLTQSLHRYYPDLGDAAVRAAIRHYQDFYLDEGIFELEVYPGVTTALADLREAGYQINIASAKPEPMLAKILPHFDLSDYFDGVYGATIDESIRSTKAAVLAYALENAEALPEDSLMIGDRDNDMLGGAQNGTKTLGVLYGFGDAAELMNAGADAVIERPDELPGGVHKLLG